MTDIERSLTEANLDAEFHVWSGQCLSIAKAIQDHFGGRIVVVSELPGEGFDHALVELNDGLYDGSGRVGWTETVTRFVAPEAQRESVDEHFYYPENPFSQFASAFNAETYQDAYDRILKSTDDEGRLDKD